MKKIICFILCAIMIMSIGIYASAEESQIATQVNGIRYEISRFGDLDSNSSVTAADARLCLRAAAKLEALPGKAMNTADINGDGQITGSDARKILRAAAKIEILNAKVPVFSAVNSTVVIAGLETAGSGRYVWHCTTENENAVKINSYAIEDELKSEVDGAPIQQYFEITVADTGTYNVKFELKNSNNEVIDEFSFDISCYYTGDKL